jgi:tellurite resistance protein TerC
MALLFNVLIYFLYENDWLGWTESTIHDMSGKEAALKFFEGYVIEKALSVDNIFVIAMVFAFFRVPASMQHRVLFWGIMGALVLRGIMIGVGAALIQRFDWTMYLFGGLLIYSAIKMLLAKEEDLHPENNLFVRAARKIFSVTSEYHGNHFFIRQEGRLTATPLFMALILVESCDVMFAVDSIPAIFSVTDDPFLVFTSNIFAILGLRSLFFAVAGLMDMFQYLKASLVFLLAFVGAKMILHKLVHIPDLASLGFIIAILSVGVIASMVASARQKSRMEASPSTEPSTTAEPESSEITDSTVSGDGADI